MLPKEFTLKELQKEENTFLLKKLILQIRKDAQMSGLEFELNENSSVEVLVDFLNKYIAELIQKDFTSYVNFLYRIDVSEKEIIKINETSLETLVSRISELILRKEWQKVWFRSRNL